MIICHSKSLEIQDYFSPYPNVFLITNGRAAILKMDLKKNGYHFSNIIYWNFIKTYLKQNKSAAYLFSNLEFSEFVLVRFSVTFKALLNSFLNMCTTEEEAREKPEFLILIRFYLIVIIIVIIALFVNFIPQSPKE